MADSPTDDDLLRQARSGDSAAFAHLYERHRDVVFRFAARLAGRADCAEDVTHDCFLDLVKAGNGFDAARATLRTYLCAAARNQVFKLFRAQGRWAGEVGDEAPDTPLDLPLQIDRVRAVDFALAALAPLQREVVVLVEYEGCTLAETAAIVGADVGTVKARLHRARAALRRMLSAHFEGPRARAAAGGRHE